MTMRAARWHGKKDIRIEEIDSPTAGPGQVLVDAVSYTHLTLPTNREV